MAAVCTFLKPERKPGRFLHPPRPAPAERLECRKALVVLLPVPLVVVDGVPDAEFVDVFIDLRQRHRSDAAVRFRADQRLQVLGRPSRARIDAEVEDA